MCSMESWQELRETESCQAARLPRPGLRATQRCKADARAAPTCGREQACREVCEQGGHGADDGLWRLPLVQEVEAQVAVHDGDLQESCCRW